MKNLLTFCFALFAFGVSFAQFGVLNRLEIDLKDDDYTNHDLFLFGEDGFVIRSLEKSRSRKTSKIKYESYNNTLVFNKDVTTEVIYNASNLRRTYNSERHIVEFVYDMKGVVNLSILDSKSLAISKYEAKAPKGAKSLSGHFASDYVVTVLRSKKEFSVLIVNVTNGKTDFQTIRIDGVKPSDMSLESISSMSNSNDAIICIDVLDKKKKDGKRTNSYFAFLDCASGTYKIVDVNKQITNTLLSVGASKTERGSYIVSGS